MHPEFLLIQLQLGEKDNELGWRLLRNFSLLCALFFIYFDTIYYNYIIETDDACSQWMENIEKQIVNINSLEIEHPFEDFKKEKEEIFQYYYRKHAY